MTKEARSSNLQFVIETYCVQPLVVESFSNRGQYELFRIKTNITIIYLKSLWSRNSFTLCHNGMIRLRGNPFNFRFFANCIYDHRSTGTKLTRELIRYIKSLVPVIKNYIYILYAHVFFVYKYIYSMYNAFNVCSKNYKSDGARFIDINSFRTHRKLDKAAAYTE